MREMLVYIKTHPHVMCIVLVLDTVSKLSNEKKILDNFLLFFIA